MTGGTRSAANRTESLDAVRAAACLMVVACHVSLYQGDASLLGLKNGVMLFFALSGYLLYRPFVRGDVDLRTYATHRVARIAPAYLVALFGVSFLTGDPTFLERPLTYLLFLQNYDLALWQGFLGVSWTLVLEVLFYLTLPALALLIARSPVRLAVLACWSLFGAFAIYLLVPATDARLTTSVFPTMIWAFTPGMFVALWEGRMDWAARPVALATGVTLLVLGMGAPWASMDVASGVGSFLIVAWAVERRPSLGYAAVLASIGAALTYSVYLWHVDMLKLIPATPLALAATVAIAAAVYLIVERPSIHLGRHVARRSTGQQVRRSALLIRPDQRIGEPDPS